MKKHLSVFELAARGAVYKTLAVGLAAAAAIFALLLAGLDDVENLADVLTGLTLPYEGREPACRAPPSRARPTARARCCSTSCWPAPSHPGAA